MRYASFLILSSVIASTSASTIGRRKTVDRPDPSNLDHCPGYTIGDADKCTFELESQGPDSVVTHLVGDPVSNCLGGTSDLVTTIGGSSTISQTFKFGVSTGFSADGGETLPIGVSFSSSDGWSNTESKTFSQNVQVTVRPGQKAALVAKVTAKTFLGRVRLNYGDRTGEPGKNDYHFVWFNNGVGSIQPTDEVVFDQKIVSCDEDI
ncbi:hypothetical protein L218DRAFT_604202 [Marasmius fiardii PR-910]|nr:hypothetical protein L218DRAFT_604202 [Marasmius fiardii PR-910]